jgi:hypothetical protein
MHRLDGKRRLSRQVPADDDHHPFTEEELLNKRLLAMVEWTPNEMTDAVRNGVVREFVLRRMSPKGGVQ